MILFDEIDNLKLLLNVIKSHLSASISSCNVAINTLSASSKLNIGMSPRSYAKSSALLTVTGVLDLKAS